MPEGDNSQRQEVARNAEFAGIMAEAIKRHVQYPDKSATEHEYLLGSLEIPVTFYYQGASRCAIKIDWNDDWDVTYHVDPEGVIKTGFIDPRETTGDPCTFWENDPAEIEDHKRFGRRFLPAPAANSIEKSLISQLAQHPMQGQKILLDIAEHAAWKNYEICPQFLSEPEGAN
ncbi:MAG TPA: hypothetical protein VMR59_04705 [Patescibacteria group bacterium]|jgi:hypothetical protein|nr:hypothetical protein [Patescibacteria group bacterium]